MSKKFKTILVVFLSLAVLVLTFKLSLLEGRLLNEDIYQIYNGINNIVQSGDLKNKDTFFIEGFKSGAKFTYFNDLGESIATKFPSSIMFYTFLVLVPGVDFYYYLNLVLGAVLVSCYYLLFRGMFGGKTWLTSLIFLNGLFVAYAVHYFESILFSLFLILGFYYYFSSKRKYLGFFFVATVQIIRPEYGLISVLLAIKELFFQKNIRYFLIVLACMMVVVGMNYKLTGYVNFLNAGIAEIDAGTGLRLEKTVFQTIADYVLLDGRIDLVFEHLLFISNKLIFVSPFLIFFFPSFLNYKIFRRSNFQIHVWLLLCIVLLYSNRAAYYGFMQTNYYSSFLRYAFPGLIYFLLMGIVFWFHMVKNVIFRFLAIVLVTFYSFLTYMSGGSNINYSLPSRLSQVKSQVFNMEQITSFIPRDSIVLSDGKMDKFAVFSDRRNIIQLIYLTEDQTRDNLKELLSLVDYIDRDIYLLYSYGNIAKVENLILENSLTHEILFQNGTFLISKLEIFYESSRSNTIQQAL